MMERLDLLHRTFKSHDYSSIVKHIEKRYKYTEGYGTLLMEEAERIARREHRSKKLAVISGVGTQHYYRKLGYMHYFSTFGYIEEGWGMGMCFILLSLAAAFVESLPISSELDDNLIVPLTSLLVGSFVF